jgi:hypothetical protein
MCFLFLLFFYNKNKVFFSLLYIYIFGCKFEVWRKKTHLILFQVRFFFNIYKFYFFLFFTLYLVSSFLESKKKTFTLQEDHPDGCCRPPVGLMGVCLPCPALPCLTPALFVTTDRQTNRQTPLLFLYIGWYGELVGGV